MAHLVFLLPYTEMVFLSDANLTSKIHNHATIGGGKDGAAAPPHFKGAS